jgi:23S rRNA (pseudouridine1915-N3)-methyltransferase
MCRHPVCRHKLRQRESNRTASRNMKIRLMMLGKTRRAEMRALIEEYTGRVGRFTAIETLEFRDGEAAMRKLTPEGGRVIVLLDAEGKRFRSEEFAAWLGEQRDRGAREILFLCGDAAGFPEGTRKLATHSMTLSSFTLSHELARVVLAEQLYRAFAILAGHPYPK